MVLFGRNLKKVVKYFSNSNIYLFESKSVSTVSSLFQPINLLQKDAVIKKDEPTSKSQKVSHMMVLNFLGSL